MHTERALQFRAAQVRAWAVVLLCASLFTALHGVLGPWLWTTARGAGQWTEVCSSLGRQWVWQDAGRDEATGASSSGGTVAPAWAPPCAWAMAHQALPPASAIQVAVPAWSALGVVKPWLSGLLLGPPPDRIDRVLLTAPMRAPPVLTV